MMRIQWPARHTLRPTLSTGLFSPIFTPITMRCATPDRWVVNDGDNVHLSLDPNQEEFP
jgi:hypothetical protein